MAQLMPLPLTVSCFSKIQIGFTFLVPAHLGSPGKRPLNGCVYYYYYRHVHSVAVKLQQTQLVLAELFHELSHAAAQQQGTSYYYYYYYYWQLATSN